ncbi:hypothetical protein O181_030856 [Austropuccinia psidii MF-1]|uniref:Uncharacterized protein n=1 Tax=Austropuccinia psidii MF-1 TaxID=1389203 RepID=A0A9Q3H4M5_9BASI|nr:hypothetical protein [Austropuccinia psidii MF-1]
MKTSPIPQPRSSPVLTSHSLQPVARTRTRRRGNKLTLPFPDTQAFQNRKNLPIRVKIEGKYAVARFFRKFDKNSKEDIMHSNDIIIPGTAYEEMAVKLAWYKDELINNFQRTFDDFGRDN